MAFGGFFKKLVLLVLIVAIAIPLRYGSTDPEYLFVRTLHSILSLKHSIIHDSTRPTLSAEYRAFESILRMIPKTKPDPLADPLPRVKELRSSMNFNAIIPKPSLCQVNKEIFEHDGHTVDAYWVDHRQENSETKSDRILLYFHGGGYVAGDIKAYSGIECHLSRLFNVTVLHLEYRLSPEHILPAAVEDSVAIYRALLHRNISPSQLFIMGDSAGGGLTLLTTQAIINHQLPIPRGVIALSPWTDVSLSSESFTRNHLTDVMITMDDVKWMAKQILGSDPSQLPADNPTFSPLSGSFKGFPPTYINVGTAELAEDDSRRVVKKAQEAGVNVVLEEGLHLMHVYPLFFPYYPEAQNTLDNINKWVQTIFTENDNQ